jgi:predicted metal-dependent phosphoesterase TrpH
VTGVDLHTHSTASDGRLPPARVVEHAAAGGVRLVALTDHDTTAGLEEARSEAARLGLAFVPGIELSAEWRGRSIHVLGLLIDPAAPALVRGVRNLAVERERRAVEIARRLDRAGVPGGDALERTRGWSDLPTRTHFARALCELGAVRSMAEAFDRYLARGRPAEVRSRWPAMAEALAWVVAAGGTAVLAHPLRYPLSGGQRRELAREFREAGGRAIEVACGGGSAAQVEQAASLALRTGLAGSVGSDFHDPDVPWNQPGRLAKLPASIRPVWNDTGFPAVPARAA